MSPHFTHIKVCAVILAGGQSSRMGTDKAFTMLHGQPMVSHVLHRVRATQPDDIVIISNEPEKYADFSVRVIPDLIAGQGPLGGIFTALVATTHNHLLLVACDTPLVSPDLLHLLIQTQQAATYQAVVPQHAGRTHALQALYHRSCHPIVKQHLEQRHLRLRDVFDKVNTHYLTERDYAHIPRAQTSFLNVNTPADLKQLESTFGEKDVFYYE